MTISQDLMMSILALDAYNRGYNSGIVLTGNQIGTATIGSDSSGLVDIEGNRIDQPASFFAQAYTLDTGQTVISYRGTDQATA